MTSAADSHPGAGWSASDVDLAELLASPVGLSGRELGDRLVEIERVRRALEAATVAVLDETDGSGSSRDDGHLTLGSWARATVHWSYGESVTRLRELDLVRLCPQVADRLAAGTIGIAHTGELARARANPRAGDRIDDAIDELLGWADQLGVDPFRKVVRRWEQLADVEGAHRDREAAHEGRRVSLTRLDDTFHVSAQFGVIQGTAIATILDTFCEAEYHTEWEKLQAEHGDQATPSMLGRTAGQRRADALYAVFLASVTDDKGNVPRPLVNLVCDINTFEEHLARKTAGLAPTTDVAPLDGHVSMGTGLGLRRCETIDGAPVDPGDVLTASLIGHVRRVVLNRAGVVVDAGRKQRLFTGTARELVWLAGTTCCWPGCGHRLGIQVDHMDEYSSRAGPTDQANADPLDGHHNRFKSIHGYRITRDHDGFLHTWRPDGTELTPR
jgi:hypothetical protein